MLARLSQWLRKSRGVEATEPPRPDLTAEERQLATSSSSPTRSQASKRGLLDLISRPAETVRFRWAASTGCRPALLQVWCG